MTGSYEISSLFEYDNLKIKICEGNLKVGTKMISEIGLEHIIEMNPSKTRMRTLAKKKFEGKEFYSTNFYHQEGDGEWKHIQGKEISLEEYQKKLNSLGVKN